MNTKIVIQVRRVYGVSTIYPVCEQAKLLANIAGTKTLKNETLAYAERMGFSIVNQPDYEAERQALRGLSIGAAV
jgi:hypothetical protein